MSVAPREKTGRIKEVSISLADLAKNIDIDGDGEIEPDEQEILDTLRSMDVDGDGTISLKELVNLGARLNEQRDQAKFYKKVAYGVLVVAVLAISAVFLACFAAVEASKDARPGSDGVMKTVTVGSDPKVVATAGYQEAIALTALHAASFATLRGIKDVGFKVGNRLYQYTVTGFEQDINTDGSSNVRLFTSRGDSIFVSKTAANLERSQTGQIIDITAAALQNRKLLSELSEHHRRSLLQATVEDDGSLTGGSVSTSAQQTEYDPIAMAALAAQADTNTTDFQLPPFAWEATCPPFMEHDTETGECGCQGAFKGRAKFDDDKGWIDVEPCEFVSPPEGTVWECDFKKGDCHVECAVTGDEVTLEELEVWNNVTNMMEEKYAWQILSGAKESCDLPDLPLNVGDFKLETIQTNTTQFLFQLKVEYQFKCAAGYSSTSATGPIFDKETKTWTEQCTVATIPDTFATAEMISNSSSNETDGKYKEHTVCKEGYHSMSPHMWFPGFPWDPIARWVPYMDLRDKFEEFNKLKSTVPSLMNETNVSLSPLPIDPRTNTTFYFSSDCKINKPGYTYRCNEGFCDVEEVPSSNKKIRFRRDMADDGEENIYASCADGYMGAVTWSYINKTWEEHCADVLPHCPFDSLLASGNNTNNAGCVCNPRSHKGPGYRLEKFYEPEMVDGMYAVGKFVRKSDKGISGCKKKKCPAKTKDLMPEDPNYLECVCKVPSTNGFAKFNETTMTWDTSQCEDMPTGTTAQINFNKCPHVYKYNNNDIDQPVTGTATYNTQTGACECPSNSANPWGLYQEKPSMKACYENSNCTQEYVFHPDGSFTTNNSAAYDSAELSAMTENWEWYGDCTEW